MCLYMILEIVLNFMSEYTVILHNTLLLHMCKHCILPLSPSHTHQTTPASTVHHLHSSGKKQLDVFRNGCCFFCCFDGSPSDRKLTLHINPGEVGETGSHLWGDEWRDVFVCLCDRRRPASVSCGCPALVWPASLDCVTERLILHFLTNSLVQAARS